MSKSKIFWLVILLVVIITAGVAGLISFFAFEKKVLFDRSFRAWLSWSDQVSGAEWKLIFSALYGHKEYHIKFARTVRDGR